MKYGTSFINFLYSQLAKLFIFLKLPTFTFATYSSRFQCLGRPILNLFFLFFLLLIPSVTGFPVFFFSGHLHLLSVLGYSVFLSLSISLLILAQQNTYYQAYLTSIQGLVQKNFFSDRVDLCKTRLGIVQCDML